MAVMGLENLVLQLRVYNAGVFLAKSHNNLNFGPGPHNGFACRLGTPSFDAKVRFGEKR